MFHPISGTNICIVTKLIQVRNWRVQNIDEVLVTLTSFHNIRIRRNF